MTAGFHVDATKFTRLIDERASLFGRSRNEEVKSQALLLAHELIQRTPPLSGKVIAKIVKARGQELRNPESESLNERRIGERAVERDRRRKAKRLGLSGQDLTDDIKRHKAHVGMAKAGWMPSFIRAGGKPPSARGWIGRHGNSQGTAVSFVEKGKILFELINQSSWAAASEVSRVVASALARRERALANQIKHAMKKAFGVHIKV